MYVFIWYCFDDYLARVTGNPDLGTVPWWVVFCIGLMTCVFHRSITITTKS